MDLIESVTMKANVLCVWKDRTKDVETICIARTLLTPPSFPFSCAVVVHQFVHDDAYGGETLADKFLAIGRVFVGRQFNDSKDLLAKRAERQFGWAADLRVRIQREAQHRRTSSVV
jgi:hypothetical protein